MEVFLIWTIVAVACGAVAASKDRTFFGWFILGFLFSFIALIVVACLPSRRRGVAPPSPNSHVKCLDCAELVLREARVCKHCNCRLVPQAV